MKFSSLTIVALASLAVCSCKPKEAPVQDTTSEDDVILHAWSWSFDTIAANMKTIAEAGYAYVQTSPAQTSYVGDNGGLALFGTKENGKEGKWYYYYQPTDWKVGNYLLGSRESFKAMADSANKYGVKVIVDVLPNHTSVDRSGVLPGLLDAVGGMDKLYHANGLTPIQNWNDRYECTTGCMGGLPDVNTENPDFQKYYMEYVNDLLGLGARGFRYDTAKHIGLPSDPLDSLATRNNFWDVATGRESVLGVSLALPADSLFIYGEVLQDKNVKEKEYTEYMDITASNYGHAMRHVLEQGAGADTLLVDWLIPVDPSKIVTWVESHDTYANEHESAGLTDDQIRSGWVFLAARQHGTPLFFSRPAGSTRENYWGNNQVGPRGNDEFFNPEVVAANKFRKAMSGQPETLFFANDGKIAEVARGDKGAALINFASEPQTFSIGTTLPDGTYVDQVSGQEFNVANGTITGSMNPNATYILYSK